MALENIHWFLREKCQDGAHRCLFCLGPTGINEDHSDNRDINMAKILVDYGRLRDTTLGGGEPTKSKSLPEVAGILTRGGIRVSLDTNGFRLKQPLLDELTGSVHSIALPLDTINPRIQAELRGTAFVNQVASRLPNLITEIHRRSIKPGIHTVFTMANYQEIPNIYKHIKHLPFSYWKIFEYNHDLAAQGWQEITAKLGAIYYDRLVGSESLHYQGDPRLGDNDGLTANFYLMADKMSRLHDDRIQFIPRDSRGNYCFLRPNGRLGYYTGHSNDRLNYFADIFSDGLKTIDQQWQGLEPDGQPSDVDYEEFFTRQGQRPFWQKNFELSDPEAETEVDGRSWRKIDHLIDLWQQMESR
jgi:organic radical activating enzyme